jgi:hypothetical protein
MKKQRELKEVQKEPTFEIEPSQESFSEENIVEQEFEKPEKEIKKQSRMVEVVLVSSSYVVFNSGNGTNGFIEKSKLNEKNKNPNIGDYIEI